MQIIQPRHVYASPDRTTLGHIYFPYSAHMAAARFRAAGVNVVVIDENTLDRGLSGRVTGLACIGAPYYSKIINRLPRLRENSDAILVGGQGSRGLSSDEFLHLFGNATINGSDDSALQSSGLAPMPIPPQECISIDQQLADLTDEAFRLYFSREAPLYVSQGCRFSCTFCAAERSDPANRVKVRETYRELPPLARELEVIIDRSKGMNINENRFYLSNLDLFQSPDKLREFIELVENVLSRFRGHKLYFRGLSTTSAFLQAHEKFPDLIRRFVEVGLRQVGFGIDGATPEVWRAVRKPYPESACLEAVATAAEDYGIVPEALMVFGHQGHDSEKTLSLAVDTVRRLGEQYGAVPRPHVAKGLVPGNDGWRSPLQQRERSFLLENPWAFQFLDFTCLPTDLTHKDPVFRDAVRKSFLEICDLPNCLTQPVMPEDRRLSKSALEEAVAFNLGRFDI